MANVKLGVLTALAGAAVLTACGKTDPPSAPTAPTVSVVSLSISQLPASLKPGETAQLVAMATLSDGSTQVATSLASWSTSAPQILSVNAAGLVTAVAPGDATVTASYQLRSITMGLSVRGGQTLRGVVTETAPTSTVPVVGAAVTVVDGLYQGTRAMTDGSGRFSLPDVAGSLNLRVSKNGFDDLALTADAGGAELTVRMMPALEIVTSVAQYTCSSPCHLNLRDQGKLSFGLHRSGTVTLSATAAVWGSDSWRHCLELRDVDTNQLMFRENVGADSFFSRTLDLAGGRTYEFRTGSCPAGGGLSGYRLVAVHPS